jgi:hypothetical protein
VIGKRESEMLLKGASRLPMSAAVVGCAFLALAATDAAQAQTTRRATEMSTPPAQAFAQARRMRPRTRLRVMPAYPYRLFSTTYPVPYEYEAPGPGHVRECASRLVPENRPSGPVIVPRMHCWWQPGHS